jgi:hypothetical protein
MRLMLVAMGALAAGALALGVGAFGATPKSATLVIRHQTRGCHSWALNGGPLTTRLSTRLARGGSLTVTNNDLMAQELVETAGPAVRQQLVRRGNMAMSAMGMEMGHGGPYTMAHMGATLRVMFPKAGTYRFKLVDRGDYMEVKTIGPDHKLRLTVVVS